MTKRLNREESEFLNDLLSDHSFQQVSPQRSIPPPLVSNHDIDMAALVEGAEDWDWADMEADFLTPKTNRVIKSEKVPIMKPSIRPAPIRVRESCTRCVVEDVIQVQANGRLQQKELIVQLEAFPGRERRSVILCDDWTQTDIRVGDIINVLGKFAPILTPSSSIVSTIRITSKANLLIHHPDLLLTATAIASAPQCRRKPLLSNLVRSSLDVTPALVWGNMLHEVMQSCMASRRWDETWVDERIDDAMTKGLADLVRLGVGVEEAKRELKLRAKGLQTFASRYMAETPKPEAILTNTRSKHDQISLLAIPKLHDIEEDIWCPTYGLKGKLDATVEAVISDPNPSSSSRTLTTGPLPFEIKTGRAIAGMAHRAQTMLYTLLAAERYGVEVPAGLLYYTQSDEVVRVPVAESWNEIRGLLGARNEMAEYMMRRNKSVELESKKDHGCGDMEEPFLPPTIDDERTCNRCYALDPCMLYRKAVENVIDDNSQIASTYVLKTGHLTPLQTAFFKSWEALLSFEEQDLIKFKKELWTMGAQEREAKGRCFGNMILDGSFVAPTSIQPAEGIGEGGSGSGSKIHQFTYKFVRAGVSGSAAAASLLSGHMDCSDAITISIAPDLLALARGFIVELSPNEVVVGVDHALNIPAIRERLSVLDSGPGRIGGSPNDNLVFRIDKDEMFGGMGRIRHNLAQLFYADGDSKRLALVVDLKPPVFDDVPSEPSSSSVLQQSAHLNVSQQHAVSKVLAAQDYALILGMPGTGKTTVIAAIIRTLVEMGKTVLLTSYTHSAVDNILLKLDGADFGILRLGNVDKVHPDARKFTLAGRKTATTVEQLEHQIMTPPVVATTCLSIDHALFSRRNFDYCIVDEASQITLPTCLGPLRFAEKFVLVGDHFQLPPLVRNHAARKGGLDVSLFRRLSDAHPQAVVDLAYQYRMNEDIMLLSNKLIYGDRLRCGSEAVAKRSLVLPNPKFLDSVHKAGKSSCTSGGCWLERLMSEGCKAIFVDTDPLPGRDSRVGDLVQNEVEANLVYQATEALLGAGVRQDQIGIISLYRQQIKCLSHLLQNRKDIEILTADRSQGRDKDCIIISMVRSNDSAHVGELVKDWRRMNVSFTRARAKLIIFGSRTTLKAAPLLAEFFALMNERGWILALPPGADKIHPVPFSSVGASSPKKRAVEAVDGAFRKENLAAMGMDRPQKKAKVKRPMIEDGLLRGRPILKDLVNNDR